MFEIRVSKGSNTKKIAGAIAGELEKNGSVGAVAIGPASVSQLVKAIAIANGFCVQNGFSLMCVPSFFNTTIEDSERTGIRFIIERLNK